MTRIRVIPLTVLFAMLLVSCGDSVDSTQYESDTFWAQNTKPGGAYYQLNAQKLYEGNKCTVWAETGSGVTVAMAQEIAGEYDQKIRPKIVNTFSKKNFDVVNDKGTVYRFADMLDYANRLAGKNDNKLTILLLDIKDDYKNKETDSYVAGYFFGGNFYEKGKIEGTDYYSNARDMIYIDTNPGLDPSRKEQTYATFAHELQHLVNFVTTVWMERDDFMDTWVNEGLSAYAEYLYLGKETLARCGWFSKDPAGTIAKGNNFFVWDNHTEDNLSILDEYATVYLFFRWLSLQANDKGVPNIFYDIITSSYHDYHAVTDVAKKIDALYEWDRLLETWLSANYDPKNISYGYIGDTLLQNNITVKKVSDSTISLYPGEGVYSTGSSASGSNINYITLSGNSTNTGNALLAFNTSTDNIKGGPVDVTLANITTAASVAPSPATGRQIGGYTGPYVIDAGDILGRNRERELLGIIKPFGNEP